MKQLIVLGFGFFLLIPSCKTSQSYSTENEDAPCVPNTQESCVCPVHSDPVCGCDNKTYLNPCHAKCSNVTYVSGKCKDNNKK